MIFAGLKNLLAKSSLLLLARFAGAILAFAGGILIARFFGATALGMVALMGAITGLLSVGISTGRPAVAIQFASEYLEIKKYGAINGFLHRGYKIIGGLSAIIVLLALLFASTAPFGVSSDTIYACLFAALSAPALALINFNGGILTGHGMQLRALIPELLFKPMLLLLGIGLLLAAPLSAPYWLLAMIACTLWITLGVQMLLVRSKLKFRSADPDYGDARRWRGRATPWIAITLLADYLIELHLLLAGLLLMPAQLAVLHVAFRMRMLASFGMRALYSVVLPDIYTAHTAGDTNRVNRELTKSNGLALVYALAACTGMYLFGELFLGFFGPEFKVGHDALMIACLTMIPKAIFGPATNIMSVAGRQKPMIVILLAGMLASAFVIFAMFPNAGITGIAVGYATAITFISIAQWWWTLKETGIDCSIFSTLINNSRIGIKTST
ncbi:MAG: lipopolysaccharide biosynthesis protein [Rhizobiales bacterium]|nr:lipopolysaccharide biosynthesis protein [Hyphomicrobiales bacterium]